MFTKNLEIPRNSDYTLKFEFLGQGNSAYEFDDSSQGLELQFSDMENKIIPDPIDIDLGNIENPVSVVIPADTLNLFKNNPIKYKLVFTKDNQQFPLLSGNIYLI